MTLRPGCVEACPGCAHRGWPAAESQAQKTAWLRRKLAPWADRLAPLRAVAEAARWSYRDRVCLAAQWTEAGWRFGLRARRELVPIPACPVHSARVRATVALLAEALPPGPAFPMAFFVQSGAQVTLVLKTPALPEAGWMTEPVARALEAAGVEGLWVHLHPSAGRRIFARRGWHLLWGRPRSVDAHGLRCGPAAFQQLLPALYGAALEEAEAFLAPTAGDAVVDLYSGGGSTLVRWTGRGAAAVGVELGEEAVACARENAPSALVLRGLCAQRIPQLRAWAGAAASGGRRLLYANPPRTGLEPEVLHWTATDLRPDRLAYLSCSAGTLRRDLEALGAAGYRVERITPYDFFPQTYHVEALALLERQP